MGLILKLQAEKFPKQLGHENYTCTNEWLNHFKNQQIKMWQVNGKISAYNAKKVTANKIHITQIKLDCFIRCPMQHSNFRGEKYVGIKRYKNDVMDLTCVNMVGTNKKY
jgi:hypothetical protein